MSLADHIDRETVYVSTGQGVKRDAYHTDPTCRTLRRANGFREVPTDALYDRRECKICSGEADSASIDGPRHKPTCRTCGDTLDDDDTCPFCEAFDAL